MKAYFSCGAGDFIAIESFLTLKQKKKITEFILLTRAGEWIKQLISLHPIWRDCKVQIPMTPKQIRNYGVYSFFNISNLIKVTKTSWVESLFENVIDYSGEVLYPDILSGKTKYTESLFEVKERKVVLACDPSSDADDRLVKAGRNFTEEEGDIILKKFKHVDRKKEFINLGIGNTTMAESLGYVKGCEYFYGVDSMLSVWAARQKGIKTIKVKTVNPIYRKWKKIYDPFNRIQIVEGMKW